MRREIFNKLDDVKEQIKKLLGVDVSMEVNTGRRKMKTFNGSIQQVYPSVFTFEDLDGKVKTFSYTEVLCGNIKFL